MQPSTLPFFVYGTLLPNQPNFYLWGDSITAMIPATFFGGKLYDMGFYPMLVAAKMETAVYGQLVKVKEAAYEAVLHRLDELEGYDPTQSEDSAYKRQQVTVTMADGRRVTAWLYQGSPTMVKGKPEIPSGDWAAYTAASRAELEEWWQTIRSVAGLHPKE